MRVVTFSWEYPPIIEGGLARHVRKLSEELAATGVGVHVITRGETTARTRELRHGVTVHRIAAPPMPRDIDAFLDWVAAMNEAMERAARRRGKVRFIVAGTGTAEAELRRQAWRLGLSRTGRFLGWVGDDMLHSLYRIADLCIVPSIYEPFGIVALEAMASGCLCVVADTGGLREVIPGDGTVGLRFPSRDRAALQEILERVLVDDALRRQLVAEAREHVLRFDWARVAHDTAGVYRQLLAGDTAALRR